MLFVGNERGNGAELAQHLMNGHDNEHVTVHAIEGFIGDDLFSAFAETEAISEGTQCQNYLYSLSLNPPCDAKVPVDVFEKTIARIEQEFGLQEQPRAVVFHEKGGRRHCHCVWSRIDASLMKAIPLSLTKSRLMNISRDLYQAYGWDMPAGFEDWRERDPFKYSREEAQQAKRATHDPKELKALFKGCWEQSDNRASFAAALWSEGYCLAQGDRRGFVAVDANGEVYSLSRWCGVKTKELRRRLGKSDELPSVEEAQAILHGTDKANKTTASTLPDQNFEARHNALIKAQRIERETLLSMQTQRRILETQTRQSRMPKGLRMIWARLSGAHERILKELAAEAAACDARDKEERQRLIEKHLKESEALAQKTSHTHSDKSAFTEKLERTFSAALLPDPRQALILPKEKLPFTREELHRNPALILDHISEKQARFTELDIKRSLAKFIDDPLSLRTAIDTALASRELVRIPDSGSSDFTTRSYCHAENVLFSTSSVMIERGGFGVSSKHIKWAHSKQNAKMRNAFGGQLSDEQKTALYRVLGDKQLVNIVGLAGAGKSTMLNAARLAWEKQGIKTHGAALSGKAAESLQTSSGINSRTLASFELSWEHGNQPIKKGEILVIDEAGMIGTLQLSRITNRIKDIGAKLVLVGDPDQLQPIEAGTPFRRLIENHESVRLTEIHRQKEDWQKQASRDLADEKIRDAIAAYDQNGAVHHDVDRNSTLSALVESYLTDTETHPHSSRLAFAHRRQDVYDLNQAIRGALRQSLNAPDEEHLIDTDTGPRAFSVGDRIVSPATIRNWG